jgi:outer membrane autotransporter protein
MRRLAYLLAGTALASAGFTGEAAAACTVATGAPNSVNCLADTTTTNTTNLNAATAASSDRIQNFNNGAGIFANIANPVTVGGFGLNLLLGNAGGNNFIDVVNNGVITSNQAVNALQLDGNGGDVTYTATLGNVTNTGTGGALAITSNGGIAGVNLDGTAMIQSAAGIGINIASGGGGVGILGFAANSVIGGTSGIFVRTSGGGLNISGLGLVQGSSLANAVIDVATGGGGLTIAGIDLITNTTGGGAVVADSGGGPLAFMNNGNITGNVLLASNGGGLSVSGNGNFTGSGFALSANSGAGGIAIANNGNFTGASGLAAITTGGAISIQGNGAITGTTGDGITAISGADSVNIGSITPNGAIFGALNGIVASGNLVSITTGGTVTGVSGAGILSSSVNLLTVITLNHNVTGGQTGITAAAVNGLIAINNNATITGGVNAVTGSTTGQFVLSNAGIMNGGINVTGSIVGGSFLDNSGTWNTGTGNSTFSGNLINSGTANALNGVGSQVLNVIGTYGGGGTVRVDLGDRLQMGGTANLTGGTLNYTFAGGVLAPSYTVLTSAGLGGTTFASTSSTNPNLQSSVTYTATDVIVNILAAQLGTGTSLNQNQQSVATSISNFFNGGGALPAGFTALFNLTGTPLANALTQISGEVATGLQPAANLSMGMFLNAMLDPFVTGRTGGFGSAMSYAPQTPSRVEVAAREAFAADMPVKARPPIATFEQRWSIWGAAYGGQNRTDGDVIVGSNDLRATAAGFAAGADYRVSRDTVMGMAVAVGQTRWNVSPALGKGDSDVAQVGGYASTRWDNMYLSGAVAFAWHRAATERTVTVAGTDRLEADFDATSIGGRLEGGYRFGGAQYGFTPYAALQVQSLHTPGYSEFATMGNNQFALTFASQTTTDIRSELGFWADTRFLFAGHTMLLRGRAAWVHDYNPGSRINPAFQALPGASFTINGAAAPRDAALTSAVAEVRLTNGWTVIAKGDGEFSGRSTTVTGTGTARYTW